VFFAEKYDNKDQYLGVYSSVTESECNMDIVLNPAGTGKAIQICRLEDGSQEDVTEETSFRWAIKGSSIFLYYSNTEIELAYDSSLFCEIIELKGVASGLVLKTKGNNIFEGYGDRFWKDRQECK